MFVLYNKYHYILLFLLFIYGKVAYANNIESNSNKLYINNTLIETQSNYNKFFKTKIENPKCQKDWQHKVCDGSIMCYATKCLYVNVDIETFHYVFLQNLITYLQERKYKTEYKKIEHLKEILKYGIPKDSKKHVFEFKDTDKTCYYSLWKKNANTLEFNLTGCMSANNQEVIHTLTQIDNDVIETYKHIAY